MSLILTEREVERIVEKIRKLECPFCPEKTKTFSGLLNHINSKHPIGNTCPVCGFESEKYLSIHLSKQEDRAHKLIYAIFCQIGRRRKGVRDIRKEIFGDFM